MIELHDSPARLDRTLGKEGSVKPPNSEDELLQYSTAEPQSEKPALS
jgi:hypothetical protein